MIDVGRAQAADGDAWQAHGLIRAASGGAVGVATGARMMASGLAKPWWNNADVHDPGAADVAELTRWYEARGLPWGMRVPAGAAWSHGRLLFRNRLMALTPSAFRPAPPAVGVTMRPAVEDDIAVVAAIDAEAFGGDPTPEWLAPLLRSREALVAIASLGGRAVGTGYALHSDGWAGRSALLAGVAVVPAARRRGIAGAMSSWLVEHALDRGAQMSVLNPDSDEAARVYARLGYTESSGFDIYLAR